MSLNGTAQTFIPYTLNGINTLATPNDISTCVKYSGNNSDTNLDGYDLGTTGTLSAQFLALPADNTKTEDFVMYSISTNGNLSSVGGLITQNLTTGQSMYFTGGVVGAPNFQFTTLGTNGKVVVTDGNRVMSTTISAGQLDYITALTSQAGGVGQANTWTGTNDFTTLTSVAALRITSSASNVDYSVSVNGTDYLEFTNLLSLQKVYTDGDSFWIPNRIFCNSTIYTSDLQMGSAIYFAYGTGQQWGTTLNGSGEYEIQDDIGDTRLKLSKSTGLTVSTLNVTAVPSATPTLALGVNGSGGVVSFAVPTPAVNLLPLNNTWTGTNTFQSTVSILDTTTTSIAGYTTAILQIAGITAAASGPATITGSFLLTPNPTTSPVASCYSPTQNFITGAQYRFLFTGFSYGIFGMSLTMCQANVANSASVAISASFPFTSGTFTGAFTPNVNPSFLGQVFLLFQGTANKTFSWTGFSYEVGSQKTTGAFEVNGIANINGGTQFAVANNYMATGSLTIGDNTRNYGGGTTTWNSNTAGLMMECLDNTEIAVHDAGLRVASLMYYDGPNNIIRLGRDMGWGVSNVATAGSLTVATDFTVNVDFKKVGGNSGTNWFSIRGTDTFNSPYLEFFVGSSRRCYIGYATTTSMNIFTENGANLQLGSEGTTRMVVNTAGDVVATNNLSAACLIVNGGGTYQPGCLFSNGDWGLLFRARVVGSLAGGIFAWYDSAGGEKMKINTAGQLLLTTTDGPGFVHTNGTVIVESYIGGSGGWFGTRTNHPLRFYTNNSTTRMSVNIDGTVNVATRLAIGGVNSNGVLDIVNPNGTYTHLGWTDNNNYFRGVNTIMDTALTLSTSGGAGGLPRIQSGDTNRSMRYDDGNLVTWLLNNGGSSPIPYSHSSWGAGSGGGYTVIARSQGIYEMGLGFGVSSAGAYRSVIISLAPAVIWGELILSGGTIYTSCNGVVNLYTAGGGWVFISDKRCKKDIKDIKTTRSLERIMSLKPKTYKKIYPENPETPISDKVRNADHIGFLAQDVLETNPHCVDEWVDDKSVCDDDDGTRLGIAYGDINIHMVGSIQELKKQNDAQQKEIDELKELVRQLLERSGSAK